MEGSPYYFLEPSAGDCDFTHSLDGSLPRSTENAADLKSGEDAADHCGKGIYMGVPDVSAWGLSSFFRPDPSGSRNPEDENFNYRNCSAIGSILSPSYLRRRERKTMGMARTDFDGVWNKRNERHEVAGC